jgi:hypothetical protein
VYGAPVTGNGRRTGSASLPLHGGKAPSWLFGRMVRLSRAIVAHLSSEHGPEEVLRRLSDPFWFQALGCGWAVVQQGMRTTDRTARRFHWLGEHVDSFVEEPHAAVCADRRGEEVLNLVATESGAARTTIAEVARATRPDDAEKLLAALPTLRLPRRHPLIAAADIDPRHLRKVLVETYENPPEDFEALLGVRGLGPKTLRALALVSELLYGSPASTRDPARFAFAHGGKDGTPTPVDRAAYDTTIETLNRALHGGGVDRSERVAALKRLSRLEP